jgi:hypothetical protein
VGTGQPDEIAVAAGDELLGLGQGRDPTCDDRRQTGRARHREARRQHVAGRLVHPADELLLAEVAPDRDVDEVDEAGALERRCDRDQLLDGGPAGDRLDRQPDPERELGSDPLTDGLGDLHRESHPAVEVAAVLVVAEVRQRRQELVHQIAMREVQLDSVEPAGENPARSLGECIDDFSDLRMVHRDRHHARRIRLYGRGRPGRLAELGGERLRTAVVELLEDLAAERSQRRHQALVAGDDLVGPEPEPAHPAVVNGPDLEDRQPGATTRGGRVVRDQLLVDQPVRAIQTRPVGGPDDPIRDLRGAEPPRFEQPFDADLAADRATLRRTGSQAPAMRP